MFSQQEKVLASALIKKGVITAQQFQECITFVHMQRSKGHQCDFPMALINKGFLTKERLLPIMQEIDSKLNLASMQQTKAQSIPQSSSQGNASFSAPVDNTQKFDQKVVLAPQEQEQEFEFGETHKVPIQQQENLADTLPAPATKSAPKPAKRILGHYDIIQELGRGGMSVVYKAKDTENSELCAIKVITTYGKDESGDMARFNREAQTMAILDHPNIIKLLDAQVDAKYFYLIMEYLQGETLYEYMCDVQMPYITALSLTKIMAEVLHYIHEKGVIHRDLKPENIMINNQFRPILMDFGVTKLVDGERLTTTGSVMGTPLYMSPDQITGDSSKIDHRSDIYSLGAIFYEMLTGHITIGDCKDIRKLIIAVTKKLPPVPSSIKPDIPKGIDEVCMKALAKKPKDRYQNGQEFANALAPFVVGAPPIEEQLQKLYNHMKGL